MIESATIEHRPREQEERLRSGQSVTVRSPSCAVERGLRAYYRRPVTANASVFTDELLAGCLAPRWHPRVVAALPECDRARLRLAVAAVHGVERAWRSLYGSHLSADERLLAVMVWRRDDRFNNNAVLDFIRETRLEFAAGRRLVELGAIADDAERRARAQLLSLSGPVFPLSIVAPPIVAPPTVGFNFSAEIENARATLLQTRFSGIAVDAVGKSLGIAGVAPDIAYSGVPTSLLGGVTGLVGASPMPLAVSPMRMAGLAHAPSAFTVFQLAVKSLGVTTKFPPSVGLPTLTAGLPGPLGLGAVLGKPFYVDLSLSSFLPDMGASLSALISTPPLGWVEDAVACGQFEAVWAGHRLWFVLSGVRPLAARRLVGLTEVEVEGIVLDALEAVVRDGEFAGALKLAVSHAPLLKSVQRRNLRHALEHAAAGEYVDAAPPLYWGLEGAFWQAGYDVPVVTRERTRLDNPNKAVGFETMLKLLNMEREAQTFMLRVLFGTEGDPYRHGEGSGGERRQVLYGVVAIAFWLETYAGAPMLSQLDGRLAQALP